MEDNGMSQAGIKQDPVLLFGKVDLNQQRDSIFCLNRLISRIEMKGEPRPLNILRIGDEHVDVILDERGDDYLICKWHLLSLLGRPSIAIKFG